MFVTCGGQRIWQGNRHYYITRHDGHLPSNYTYLSHDDIGGHQADLGSWFNVKLRILAEVPN
jgi:hypothetical protein